MRNKRWSVTIGIAFVGYLGAAGMFAPLPARAASLTVDATANIFGAGHSTAPNPGGGSGGTLPPEYSFASGSGQTLAISAVTGTVALTPGYPNNGGGTTAFSTNISSYGGIAGIADPYRSGFLVGVFLSATEPSDPAPPRLTFSDADSYTSLSPLLDQTFFIGVGQTSGGMVTFDVPTGASRLYLGFADAYGYSGLPGQYQDNSGSLQVSFSISAVPEPSGFLMLIAGALGLLGGVRRFRDAKATQCCVRR